MKRLYLIGLVLLLFAETNTVFGQEKLAQSNVLQHYADSIYGDLSVNIPSGYLLNRTLTDTNSLIFNLPKWKDSTVTADYFYQAVNELSLMKVRLSNVPDMLPLFDEVRSYVGGIEFEEEKTVIPIGILDINYEWLDEKSGLSKGLIKQSAGRFSDNAQAKSVYFQKNVKLVAPLYDYFVLENVAVTFRKEHFYSNYRTADDISSIVLTHNGISRRINFDEIYNIKTGRTDELFFTVKIIYTNGQEIENTFKIHTPKDFELSPDGAKKKDDGFTAKSGYSFPENRYEGSVGIVKDSRMLFLKYCFIPSFCNDEADKKDPEYKPIKPYILMTGYRPPIFSQSFKKTWDIYSDNHDHLLHQLRLNGYDIIIVKFNMDEVPYVLGLQEMAELFELFLNDLNVRKGENRYNENVIQGSSMSGDVARLALIRMERKHFQNNNYPHHHSRLFITYDGNNYGANLPLAYQMQIYSGMIYPNPLAYLNPITAGIELGSLVLKSFLLSTLEQKATKELLMYHVKGIGNADFFNSPFRTRTWQPTHTQLRQNFLNVLQSEYDNLGYYPHGKLFTPVPSGTRNVAISLGKISDPNESNSQNLYFKTAGAYWRDVTIPIFYRHIMRAGVYNSSSSGALLFKRRLGVKIGNAELNLINHELNVHKMQHVDNAAGSYLAGEGNILAVTNIVYGFNFLNIFDQPKFAHKSVLSALAINPNIWPSNGSHTLNMQGLNLMYNSFSGLANSTQSNFFGYPNLGRPSDHFSVTPFEAIYVGEKIYPHIDLEKARPIDVQAINDFIKNEVEPWYLGLQNENLGAQARSNYTYKAFRRAKYSIVVGNLVTPKTDPGDYVVEPNADLRLEAGQQIVLKPGVHIKNGATAHLKIAYQECFETNGLRVQDPVSAHSEEVNDLQRDDYLTTNIVEKEMITVFPNPTNGNFTVKTDNIINVITIYTINGQLIERISDINNSKYDCSNVLERGTYLLVIEAEDRKVFYKKLVVL